MSFQLFSTQKRFATLFALGLLSACTATPEEIAKRQSFETQMANISLSVAQEDVAIAAPQCLRDIAGQSVDETALAAAGYAKTKALLGGFSYKKSISPAGFAKYENSRRVVAGSPGGDCRFEAVSGSSVTAYRAALETYLQQAGYTVAAKDGGIFKNIPRYTGKGLNFTVTMVAERGAPIAGFGMSAVK